MLGELAYPIHIFNQPINMMSMASRSSFLDLHSGPPKSERWVPSPFPSLPRGQIHSCTIASTVGMLWFRMQRLGTLKGPAARCLWPAGTSSGGCSAISPSRVIRLILPVRSEIAS